MEIATNSEKYWIMLSLISSIEGILDYNGNKLDTLLNYTAIVVNLVPLIFLFNLLPQSYGTLRYFWILYTILLFIFQIGLCLVVGCFGVSIVWSALCSFVVYSYTVIFQPRCTGIDSNDSSNIKVSVFLSVLFSIILWTYYAFVEDFITSLAHFCAVMLGLVSGQAVHVFIRRNYQASQYVTVESVLSPLPESVSSPSESEYEASVYSFVNQ